MRAFVIRGPIRISALLGLVLFGTAANRTSAQTIELISANVACLQKGEQERFLAAHNAARKSVGVDSVAWSEDLSQYAQDWLAEQKDRLIDEAKKGWEEGNVVLPKHRLDGKYGENIAAWGGGNVPGAEWGVSLWLKEKPAFDKLNADDSFRYGDEEGKAETDAEGKEHPIVIGHYTAIVWRNTTHIGAAKLIFELADEKGLKRQYVALVCNYAPAGNRNGQRPF